MRRTNYTARNLLSILFNRHQINDSFLYHVYADFRYPEHANIMRRERKFYMRAVGGSEVDLIFDIGANGGDKTIQFLSVSKKVISIEPSLAAVEILRQRFFRNPRVIIVPKGVGRSVTTAPFHVIEDADPCNTLSQKWVDQLAKRDAPHGKVVSSVVHVPLTTLDELIKEYGWPDYIKIDVEGYELEVVSGLSCKVPLISLECNLPEFAPETIEAISILSTRSPGAKYNFCTTEPPTEFESEQWLCADEILATVVSGRWRYMEIFCSLRFG